LEYEVIKLGGSILKDREAFYRAVEIVDSKIRVGIIPICVVSAMKGVTDRIIDSLNKCINEVSFDPRRFIEELYEEHLVALPQGL
jgi:aspartokinase